MSPNPDAVNPPSDPFPNIPAELKALRQWVYFKVTPGNLDSEGIWVPGKKMPFTIGGTPASSTNPDTWCSYEEVMHKQYPAFCFTPGDPYCLIDFDYPRRRPGETPEDFTVREEKIHAIYAKILQAFPGYVEESVSGHGLHIIGKGNVGPGIITDGVDVWDHDRFGIFTGKGEGELRQLDQQRLDSLVSEMRRTLAPSRIGQSLPLSREDEEVLEKVRRKPRGALFLDGKGDELNHHSKSERDHEFIALLTEASGNKEQVERLFNASIYYRPEKGAGYVARSFAKVRGEAEDWEEFQNRLQDSIRSYVLAAGAGKSQAVVGPVTGTAEPATCPLLWTLDEILKFTVDPTRQIWEGGILTVGDPSAIIGAPGVGKSRISLQAAVWTILGRDFLGWKTRGVGKKWLFLQTENNGERLKFDLSRMTASLTLDELRRVNEALFILKIEAMEFSSICMKPGSPERAQIEALMKSVQPDIVVIDPFRETGRGDPNKDEIMIETCQAIKEVVKNGAPHRVPLIIHHGRTGSAEASKVFGDDAGSFGRNSKVLNGWLRSQINVSSAGIAHPGVVIFGCGKCSNGPRWKEFAAKLDEDTMCYTRLGPEEFDMAKWEEEAASGKRHAPSMVGPQDVAKVLKDNGGRLSGAVNATDGLVAKVREGLRLSRGVATELVKRAVGVTIESVEEPRKGSGKGASGGKPQTFYQLKPPTLLDGIAAQDGVED